MRLSAFDPLSLAAQALTGAVGSSTPSTGAAMPSASGSTVSPTIQTAISPQISPVFIQTGAGSTGDISAGTTMSAGTHQGASPYPAAPYSDIGYPSSGQPPDIAPFPAPALVQSDYSRYIPYAMGAIAIIAVASMLKKKRRGVTRYRRMGRG